MSTELTIGKWTLEQWQPREWRAWVRLEKDVPLETGDEIQLKGSWVLANWMRRGTSEDYRRPVPLPSLEELVEAISHRGFSLKVFTHPESGEETIILAKSYYWLRTLLPGYEQAVAKASVVANSATTAPSSDESDKPAKTDEWRGIESAPKDGSEFDVWATFHGRKPDVRFIDGEICEYTTSMFGDWKWYPLDTEVTHWMPKPKGPNGVEPL
ncbi:hypothetical protein [Planctomyces sp. SH-PL14]|uniref:hypothetical protein n=1 Tax=Planctomyces sp. SH-PL14 TaxID=1632864 RepID=UPI00078E67DD|nr:hypothetical protein [Planctomyces sp. SH-PL14]AMV20443.1 hypothetical protein VT03_21270 [Planctomyces sp. SH-PL14]